jgi:hypothetical protein
MWGIIAFKALLTRKKAYMEELQLGRLVARNF